MIKLITAVDKNGAIGNKGQLLYSCKVDMKHFAAVTRNSVVIMGRNTFFSLGAPVGLPGRFNIVITKDPIFTKYLQNLARKFAPDTLYVVSSLDDAICIGDDIVKTATKTKYNDIEWQNHMYIIGGASVYNEAIRRRLAEKLIITHYEYIAPEADAFIDMRSLYSEYECMSMETMYDPEHDVAHILSTYTLNDKDKVEYKPINSSSCNDLHTGMIHF